MQLRPYQAEGKSLVRNSFYNGSNATVLRADTGAGKTVMFSDITHSALDNGTPTMVLCNRKELIEQADGKLKNFDLNATLINPSYKDRVSNLYVASIDTLRNRKLPDIGLLIIDEAHIRAFDEIALTYKHRGTKIIGATATPIRTGKRFFKESTPNDLFNLYPDYTGQMGNVYDDMVCPITISELINKNYLVPEITYGAEVDLEGVDIVNTSNGLEYNEKQLFNKFNKPKMYAGVVDKYLELTPGTKALVFNINVEHSIKQTAEFNLRGIPSAHLDGKTPKPIREKILKDFKYGIIKVLNNCSVLTTGYDEESIETIILNRATASLALYLQMCGRGGRICELIMKRYFNIIDMGSNVWKHGWWSDEREWSLDLKFVSKTIGVGVVKTCSNCKALIPASSTSCKHCKVIQEKKEQDKILIDAKFIKLDKETFKKPIEKMTVSELETYREQKEFSVAWIVRQLLFRSENDLKEYAALITPNKKAYSIAWAYKQIEMSNKNREETKSHIWEFIQTNPHITEDYLKDYAIKKLKANHSPQQIEFLIPKILQAAKDLVTINN